MTPTLQVIECTKILIGKAMPYEFLVEVYSVKDEAKPDHAYVVRNGLGGDSRSIYSIKFDEKSRMIKISAIGKNVQLMTSDTTAAMNKVLHSLWGGGSLSYVY